MEKSEGELSDSETEEARPPPPKRARKVPEEIADPEPELGKRRERNSKQRAGEKIKKILERDMGKLEEASKVQTEGTGLQRTKKQERYKRRKARKKLRRKLQWMIAESGKIKESLVEEEEEEPAGKEEKEEPRAQRLIEKQGRNSGEKARGKPQQETAKSGEAATSTGNLSTSSEAIVAQLVTLQFSSRTLDCPQTSDDSSAQSTINHQSPPSPSGSELQEVKTAALQAAILNLLLAEDSSPDPRLQELQSRRIVVLWLSFVSASLFLESPDLFPGLQSLSPSLRLLLKHPGNDVFAKLGLEAFLFKPEVGRKSKLVNDFEGGGPGELRMTKQECLLSVKEMNDNRFPLPQQLQAKKNSLDTRDYLSLCGEWPAGREDVNCFPMFALDCEMVMTKEGHELARVSVVNDSLSCIYDKLVKPGNPVLDYKTKFSGITEDLLRDVTTSLSDVQRDLSLLLPQQSILLGHSLENDFLALKMTHPFVIDTSCLFQPLAGFKPKLRHLAERFLGMKIQTGEDGHSSVQDAQACMDLVLRKLQFGERMVLQKKDRCILTEVANSGQLVAIVDRNGLAKLVGGDKTSKYVVTGDDEVLEEARDAVPTHDFTFIQLHSYEDFVKSALSDDAPAHHMRERVLRQLDSEATDLVTFCPPGSLAVVVCGSSDISKRRSLQERGHYEGVKELVAVARTGLALSFIT